MFEYIKNYIRKFKPYKNGRWCYEDGILMKAIWDLYLQTKDKEYKDFVFDYYERMINEDGSINNYNMEEYNLDNILSGVVLFDLYDEFKKDKYLKAIEILRRQLYFQPRNNEGSFYHKLKYPNQVWLDGIYMSFIFYAKYAKLYNDNKINKDIKMQLTLVFKNLYDYDRKMFMHAYDESKRMAWCDMYGKSLHPWSRSSGWLAMAYIEIGSIDTDNKELIMYWYSLLLDGLKEHLNEGMLHQIIDREEDIENYLETSGSAMFAYSILKGIRMNMVQEEYKKYAYLIYDTIKKKYFIYEKGFLEIGGICEVAGLDEKRDGSKEYYYSEKVVRDEVKGVAPLIMLYTEILKLV